MTRVLHHVGSRTLPSPRKRPQWSPSYFCTLCTFPCLLPKSSAQAFLTASHLSSFSFQGNYPTSEGPWPQPFSLSLSQPLSLAIIPSFSVHMRMCLVTQSCLTLFDPMDCSPPGSSGHGDSPSKNTGVDCCALLQGISPTQRSNPDLPHCRWILYWLSHLLLLLLLLSHFSCVRLCATP